MKIYLVKTKSSELKEIATFYAEEYRKPPYNENWTNKKALDRLEFFNKFFDLYSIKLGNQLVGFMAVNQKFMCPGEVAYLEEFVIKSEFQRKGIGTEAIKQVVEIYKKRKYQRFMLISDTGSKAFKFYQKLGILPSKRDSLMERGLK